MRRRTFPEKEIDEIINSKNQDIYVLNTRSSKEPS